MNQEYSSQMSLDWALLDLLKKFKEAIFLASECKLWNIIKGVCFHDHFLQY